MSLIHADNFDIYGGNPALMLNGRYSSNSGATIVTDPDGTSLPKTLLYQGNGSLRRALQTPTPVVGLGLRLWLSSLPSSNDMRPMPMTWADADNHGMVRIIVNTTGSITAQVFDVDDGDFGNWFDLATTVGPVVSANAWWQLEGAFDGSALTFELRVEGIPVIECDSSDFDDHLNNGPNVYQFGLESHSTLIGESINSYYKDYFGWDGLGSLNNDFIGSCLVTDLAPDADTDLGGWEPSTGTTAWAILDTTTPGDTPFVSAPFPVPDPMTMTLTNLPDNVTSVKGVVTVLRAAKVDGGDGQVQVSMVSAGDKAEGADRPITAAMTYWEDVSELDPHTSSPWSPVSLNAASIEVDRTA